MLEVKMKSKHFVAVYNISRFSICERFVENLILILYPLDPDPDPNVYV